MDKLRLFFSGHLFDRQRPVEQRQAEDFRLGKVRPVFFTTRRKEERALRVSKALLDPLTGKDKGEFVGLLVSMSRNSDPLLKPAQHDQTARLFVAVQNLQFHSLVRARLPGFVFG